MMGTSIWMTFCLYHLFGYQITVITVLALPIVLVLSLSDAIHLLSGLSHEKDIESLLSKFIAPSLYSSATTAVAFFSFSFSDSPFIQQLGVLTGVALILEFLFSFAIAPILLTRVKINAQPPKLLDGITSLILKQKRVLHWVCWLLPSGQFFISPVEVQVRHRGVFS